MKWTLMIGCLLTAWSVAQVSDPGVAETVDEFTGQRECSHFVMNSALDLSGFSLTSVDGDLALVISRNVGRSLSESSFFAFGTMGGEVVYLRFSNGEVLTLTPTDAGRSDDRTYEFARVDPSIIPWVLTSPGDVSVRFEGPRGENDFTIFHEVMVALARGFGQQCM